MSIILNIIKLDGSVLKIITTEHLWQFPVILILWVNTQINPVNPTEAQLFFRWDGEFLFSSPAIKMTF